LAVFLQTDIPDMHSYRVFDTHLPSHQIANSRSILKPEIVLNSITGRMPKEKADSLQASAVFDDMTFEDREINYMSLLTELLADTEGHFPIDGQELDLRTWRSEKRAF